ncbi:MAG: DEAD/DEAH box helicase family protein [Bacteroidia bacterium]|nr:DEAD/DEAH box helicase family protein [Bacteroidia bacterium]MDW8300861.1 DEAD/DEAH box helicase family protein [Bacteroidia bacterium]
MSVQTQDLWQALQNAISQDGGLAVYRYYGFEPSTKPQPFNPFREERTSSFFITKKFGKYIFKDFGDDSIKGDCFKFVKLYQNTNNKQAFRILCQIYNLIETDESINKPTYAPKKQAKKTNIDKTTEKELLNISFKPFADEELAFWQKKGLVSKEMLEANGVKSVQSFSLKIGQKVRHFTNLHFIFAYEIIPQKCYKLYMPKAKYRIYAPSKTIFLPNLQPARQVLGENYAYHFGLQTLDFSKEIILCGGEPDCLALKSLGYNAFTLGAESATIPDFVWQKILEKQPHPNIKVLYDTDFTGMTNGQKLAQTYHFQQIILPKLFQQNQKQQPKPTLNDLCDYLQTYGHDADLQLALAQNIFQKQDLHLTHVPTIHVEKYLSEKTDLLLNFIQQQPYTLIEGDAGIGKTFTLLTEVAPKLTQPVLFVVPFAIQVEQIAQEYKDKIEDLVCFNNHEDSLNKSFGKVNVCTYDKIQAVFQPDMHIFIDECHLLTSEYGYRTQAINAVSKVIAQAKSVCMISATPDYSFCQDKNFKLIRFKRKNNPHVQLNICHLSENKKEHLLKILLAKVQEHQLQTRNQTLIVRLNHKSLARQIAQLLIQQNILKPQEIDFVFSFKQKGKTTPSKEAIISQGTIPKNIKILFVTACFDCGINIQNTNIAEIISFEIHYTDNCPDTLVQLVQRFRQLNPIKVLVCKPAKSEHHKPLPSLYSLRKKMYQDAYNRINLLAYQQKVYLDKLKIQMLQFEKMPAYFKVNEDISANFKILTLDKEKQFIPNENYIRFAAKEFARKNIGTAEFIAQVQQALPNVSCQIYQIEQTEKDSLNSKSTTQQLKNLAQQEKLLKAKTIEQFTQTLAQQTDNLLNTLYHTYHDLNLKQKIAQQMNPSSKQEVIPLAQILPQAQTYDGADDLTIKLAKRYFILKELLLPKDKIPTILQQFPSDAQFSLLVKTLSNQINLYAQKELSYELPLIMSDMRQIENTQFLQQVIDWIENDLQTQDFSQKRTQTYQRQIEMEKYDLKLLQYQRRNYQAIYHYLTTTREKRALGRKMQTIAKKIRKTYLYIQELNKKLEKSHIKAIEINQLSKQLNALRAHPTDKVGLKTNLRLLQTLFEIETEKKKVLQPNGSLKEQILVKIGKKLTINSFLQKIGLTFAESQAYCIHLQYKLKEDKQKRLEHLAMQSVSKIDPKAKEIPINMNHYTQTFALKPINDSLTNMPYPIFWD